MMETDAFILAIVTGGLFGVLVFIIGSTWQRLALILTLLYILQTGAQQALRMVQDKGSIDEFIAITVYRIAFSVAAVLVVALLGLWERRTTRHKEKV